MDIGRYPAPPSVKEWAARMAAEKANDRPAWRHESDERILKDCDVRSLPTDLECLHIRFTSLSREVEALRRTVLGLVAVLVVTILVNWWLRVSP